MADRVPPGFYVDYSTPDEPRVTIILRTDPWSQCSLLELRRLRKKYRADDIPDFFLRRELRGLEQRRGFYEGQFLDDLRREPDPLNTEMREVLHV